MAIEKLKRHISPGIDQILAELIKAGGRKTRSEIHGLLFIFGIRRKCLRSGKETIIVAIHKKGDKTDCTSYKGITFCHLGTKFYPTSCCQG